MPTDDEVDAPPSAADVEPFDTERLSGDVLEDLDDAVTAEWKASTTAFERVHAVLKDTTEPRTTGELADAAATTKPTVRKHVQPLVDAGMVEEDASANATRYVWSSTQRRVNRVADLAADHSPGELDAKIRRTKERLASLEETYGVDSPSDLVAQLDPDDDAGWKDLSVWRTLEDDLKRLRAAQSMTEYLVQSEPADSHGDASYHA